MSYLIGRCAIALLAAAMPATMFAQAPDPDAALMARARAIHEGVITLDTHNDMEPAYFTADQLHPAPDDASEPAEDA